MHNENEDYYKNFRGKHDPDILEVLVEGEMYGREIIDEVYRRSNGKIKIIEQSLYSVLNRFEKYGLIKSYEDESKGTGGGKRKYHSITELGIEVQNKLVEERSTPPKTKRSKKKNKNSSNKNNDNNDSQNENIVSSDKKGSDVIQRSFFDDDDYNEEVTATKHNRDDEVIDISIPREEREIAATKENERKKTERENISELHPNDFFDDEETNNNAYKVPERNQNQNAVLRKNKYANNKNKFAENTKEFNGYRYDNNDKLYRENSDYDEKINSMLIKSRIKAEKDGLASYDDAKAVIHGQSSYDEDEYFDRYEREERYNRNHSYQETNNHNNQYREEYENKEYDESSYNHEDNHDNGYTYNPYQSKKEFAKSQLFSSTSQMRYQYEQDYYEHPPVIKYEDQFNSNESQYNFHNNVTPNIDAQIEELEIAQRNYNIANRRRQQEENNTNLNYYNNYHETTHMGQPSALSLSLAELRKKPQQTEGFDPQNNVYINKHEFQKSNLDYDDLPTKNINPIQRPKVIAKQKEEFDYIDYSAISLVKEKDMDRGYKKLLRDILCLAKSDTITKIMPELAFPNDTTESTMAKALNRPYHREVLETPLSEPIKEKKSKAKRESLIIKTKLRQQETEHNNENVLHLYPEQVNLNIIQNKMQKEGFKIRTRESALDEDFYDNNILIGKAVLTTTMFTYLSLAIIMSLIYFAFNNLFDLTINTYVTILIVGLLVPLAGLIYSGINKDRKALLNTRLAYSICLSLIFAGTIFVVSCSIAFFTGIDLNVISNVFKFIILPSIIGMIMPISIFIHSIVVKNYIVSKRS